MSGPLFQLSYSAVAAFNRCRKQYWFRKLSGLPPPPPVPTAPGCLGTGLHRAMKVLCETDDRETAARALDAYLRMPAHECVGPGTPAFDNAFQLFERGCVAHDSIASDDRWAELDTWAPWPSRGVTVTARVDRVDRFADGHYQIIDWKTGRYDYDDQTDAQLDIGHLALRVSRRQLEREAPVVAIGWNLRTGQQRVRMLTGGDAVGTMRYYAALAQKIQSTTDFEATPGSGCTFCDWRERCAEAAEVDASGDAWFKDEDDEPFDGEVGDETA
jgi:RecB family exonuclease